MTRTVVSLTTDPGKDREAAEKVKDIEGVKSVCLVSGLYDVVLRVEADTAEDILSIVFDNIRGIPGVTMSHTMFCLKV